MLRLFLCLFVFANYCSAQAQENNYIAVAVGYYNLENLFDTLDNHLINDEEFTPGGDKVWTSDKYKEKIANLASVISQLGTKVCPTGFALLGVSEIENDTVLNDLISHPLLKNRSLDFVHINSSDKRGIDVALIYNTESFIPLESYLIPVDIRALGSSRPTREVLYVKGLLHDDPVHVTVNHWPSRGGGEKKTAAYRNLAASANRRIIDTILMKDPNARIMVMGDLNDNPNDESVKAYLRSENDIEKVDPTEMFNPFYAYFNEGIGTTAYRDSWSLFDQILVSPGMLNPEKGWRISGSAIYNEKYLLQPWGKYKDYPFRTFSGDRYQGGYSDHFPVLIYLTKSTEP